MVKILLVDSSFHWVANYQMFFFFYLFVLLGPSFILFQFVCNVVNLCAFLSLSLSCLSGIFFNYALGPMFLWILSCYSEDASRRRSFRGRDLRDVEKAFQVPIQYKNLNCKISTLKLVLLIIAFGTLVTLYRSPVVYIADQPSTSGSRYVYCLLLIIYEILFFSSDCFFFSF